MNTRRHALTDITGFTITVLFLASIVVAANHLTHAKRSGPVFIGANDMVVTAGTSGLARPAAASNSVANLKALNAAVPADVILPVLKADPVPLAMVPPRIVTSVFPEYPASAIKEGIEGVALVRAFISAGGDVEDVEVKTSSGNGYLDKAATTAVRQWKFEAARRGIEVIASWFEVPVRFTLSN